MKSNYWLLTVIFALVALPGKAGEWIRINQLGYLPQSVKVAVFMSEEGTNVENYSLIDAFTGKVVRTFNTTKATGNGRRRAGGDRHAACRTGRCAGAGLPPGPWLPFWWRGPSSRGRS